jgi:hypothetical protein
VEPFQTSADAPAATQNLYDVQDTLRTEPPAEGATFQTLPFQISL